MAIRLRFRPGNSSPNGLGETIELVNHRNIWRKNTSQSFNIQVPSGYSSSWQIVESRTLSTYASGTGTSVTQTFSNYTDSNGLPLFYDIIVTATKGNNLSFQRRFRRAIGVLPPLFTRAQANAIYNFASGGIAYRDNNLVDRTGYKVWCEGFGSSAGYLGLEEFVSSNPELPVHFLADTANGCGITQTGGNYCIKVVEGKNILFDGCGNSNIPYGFQLAHTTSGQQAFFIEATRDATTLANVGRNIHVCGVSIDGNEVLVGAGFQHQTAGGGATTYPYEYDGLTVHNMYVTGPMAEGVYLGYNNDGAGHSLLKNLVFFNVITEHTGGDGIQFGLCSGEVHDCTVIDAGYRNDVNHRNEIQWNPGNTNMFFYRNRCYSGKNTLSANMGTKYKNYGEIFSNLFVNRTSPVPSNFFINLYQNDFTSTADFKVFKNTIIAPNAGGSSVPFYIARPNNTVTTEFNRLILANNLLISGTTTQSGSLNISNPPANSTISNYISTNINAPGFKNHTSDDFRLASLSSAAFSTTNKSFTPAHPLANEDVDGVVYKLDVQGCYSGYELMT